MRGQHYRADAKSVVYSYIHIYMQKSKYLYNDPSKMLREVRCNVTRHGLSLDIKHHDRVRINILLRFANHNALFKVCDTKTSKIPIPINVSLF